MTKLNNFRLDYETVFLFVLSNEYDIPFAKLLGMYNISTKIFWAYIALFSNMSRMGVRKGSQLSKSANRIYKSILSIKEKNSRKVDFEVVDDDGNNVLDENGNKRTEKRVITEYTPVVLKEQEEKVKTIIKFFNTNGYSDGEHFLSENDVLDLKTSLALKSDVVKIDGNIYSSCSQIEYVLEKFFPEMTTKEFKNISIKGLQEKFEENNIYSIVAKEREAVGSRG